MAYSEEEEEAIKYLNTYFKKDLKEGSDLKLEKPKYKEVVDEEATDKARNDKLKQLLKDNNLTMEDWEEY